MSHDLDLSLQYDVEHDPEEEQAFNKWLRCYYQAWLPDGYSQIFRLYLFGPSGLKDYGSATLCCKI